MESSSPRSKFKSGQPASRNRLINRIRNREQNRGFFEDKQQDQTFINALENIEDNQVDKRHIELRHFFQQQPEEQVIPTLPQRHQDAEPLEETKEQPATYKKPKQAPKEGIVALLARLRDPSFKAQHQSLAEVINNKPWALGGPSTHTFLHPDRPHPVYPKQKQPPQSLEDCEDMMCAQNTMLNLALDNPRVLEDYQQAYDENKPTSSGDFDDKAREKWNTLFGGGEKLINDQDWQDMQNSWNQQNPEQQVANPRALRQHFKTQLEQEQIPSILEQKLGTKELPKGAVLYAENPGLHTFHTHRQGRASSPIFRSLDNPQKITEDLTLQQVLRRNYPEQNLDTSYPLKSIYYTNKYAQQ